MGYYDTLIRDTPGWWEKPDIFDAEDIARNEKYFGAGDGSMDFAGMPMSRLTLQDIGKNPKSLLDATIGIARADIDQGISTWSPRNWDTAGKTVERSRINKAIANVGEEKVLKLLANNADEFAPGALRTAASVGKQALGKTLNTAGAVVLPVVGVASDISGGINPIEATIRGGLDLVGSYGGMALGGAAGTTVAGPGLGTFGGGVAGSMAGSWLADKAADLVFGDEDKRIAENRQKQLEEQQQKANDLQWAQQTARGLRGGYLANKYLNPSLGAAEEVWGQPWQ